MAQHDWSKEQEELRQQCLIILLKHAHEQGREDNRAVYECCNEWIQGNGTTEGLVQHYEKYHMRGEPTATDYAPPNTDIRDVPVTDFNSTHTKVSKGGRTQNW